jgi:hypothetical protein
MARRAGLIFATILIMVAARVIVPIAASAQTQIQTQTGTGLTVIPPLRVYSVNPGDTRSDIIRIQNIDTRPHSVLAIPENFFSDQEGRGCVPTTRITKSPLSAWLAVSPQSHEFQPNEIFDFAFNLSVPSNAGPGGHYGAVVFQIVPDSASNNQSSVRNVVEGTSCFLVNVSGDIRLGATMLSFKAKPIKLKETIQAPIGPGVQQAPTVRKFKDVHFTTKIKNTGNTHIDVSTGKIEIKDIFGHTRAQFPVEPGQGPKYVLPDGPARILEADWKKPGIGFYHAKVKVFYDEKHPLLIGETTFWILPPFWIWLLILAAILLLIWLWRSRKRIRKSIRAFRESSDEPEPVSSSTGRQFGP